MADGIEESEREAVQELVHLATFGKEAFGVIVGTEWTSDGLTEAEVSTVDILRYTAQEDQPDLATTIASLPWVLDGVDEGEAQVVVDLGWTGLYSPELAGAVLSLLWVQDNMDVLEAAMVQELQWIAKDSSDLARVIASLPWVVDGIGQGESEVAEDLGRIGSIHPNEALRFAQMPFLTHLDPADAVALESLKRLSSLRPDSFLRIMEHPTISAGITDGWAKIVAMLYGVDKIDQQLVDALLDPEQITVDERTIQLPLAGEVELAIIRMGPGTARSMDLLEHAVRGAEAFMDTPFPTKYVALLFADAVLETFAGTNFGTHMAILPKYDADDGSYEAQYAGYIVSHEVAHYYWSGNANWIDEGAAELMAILSENARVESPLDPDNYPCSHAPNIAALERLSTSSSEGALSAFRCNYSLGERLFLDLHRSLGEDEFKRGFRSLFQASEVEGEDETNEGTSSGISELREAFGRATSTPVVTARWYEGTERFDRSRLDRGPVDPDLPSINGMFTLVGVALSYDNCLQNKRELSFSIREIPEHVTVCLKYTYDVDSPQTADLEIVVWFEDGFPLQRIIRTIEAEKEFIGAQWPAYIGPSEWNWWATGRYYVYVYNDGRKVGEAEFAVLR